MSEVERDYYEVLGVPRDADVKAIKDAFRKLAMEYHPDRNKSPDAEQRFKEIAAAYAVLSDPQKRQQYDMDGQGVGPGFSAEDLFGGMDIGDIFSNLGFGFDRSGSIFDRFFHHEQKPSSGRGRDIDLRLEVSLKRIYEGGMETVRFRHPGTCQACHGTGAKAGTSPRQCKTCAGKGQKIISKQAKEHFHFQQITTCPDCHGKGTYIDQPCVECSGRGQIEKEESLKVNIPKGAEEGLALRIPGRGMPGTQDGAASGDLYVEVYSVPDPHFKRRGQDLWREESISVTDAVLGASILVPTMEGPVNVKIPAGTQPDTVLRVKRKGLPVYNQHDYGDLNLRIVVKIPDKLDRESRKLYEKLHGLERK